MDSRASQSGFTASIQDARHILFHKEFIFCLVCQRDINSVSQHILEQGHENNFQNLFKICMQDQFFDSTDIMYADVNNSVIDISHTCTNDVNYIYKIDTNFSRIICLKNVSSADDTDDGKSNLGIQLKVERDLHFDYMKSNFSWIYRQNKTSTFMMFHNSVYYCSLCKHIVNYDDNHDLSASVIIHLESSQHQAKQNLMPLSSNLRDKRTITATPESVSSDALDQVFMHLEVSETSHHNGDSIARCIDTPDSESNYNTFDEMLQVALTCPECKEVIEILNDNEDFSLQHHFKKHVDLSDVNQAIQSEYNEDTDYVCHVCSETIPIFNKNLELSIICHFNENNHDEAFCPSEMFNGSKFLDILLSKLPQEHKVHRSFFILDGNNIFCKLCSCVLPDSSNNVTSASELLTRHISDLYHSDQYITTSQKFTLDVLNYNKDIVTRSVPNTKSLFEGLANKVTMIRDNRDFIEVQKYLYLCKICQKHICYSPNENTLMRNFVYHLNLPSHKINSNKEREKNLEASALVQIKNVPVQEKFKNNKDHKRIVQEMLLKIGEHPLFSDVKFIEHKSDTFFCRICKISMSVTTDELHVKNHIMGLKHKKMKNIWSRNEVIKESNHRAQCILSKAVKFSFIIKKNLDYIDTMNGNFFCIVCEELLSVNSSLSHLKVHLANEMHKRKLRAFDRITSRNQ